MKPEPERDELLHDLLEDSRAAGPSMDAVLQLVRTERTRRQRRNVLTGVVALFALLGALIVSQPRPHVTQQASLPAPADEPFKIQKVNDEELLELLAGQPVALLKLPNGEQQLLMVAHHAGDDAGKQ